MERIGVAVGKESIFAIPIKKLLWRPPLLWLRKWYQWLSPGWSWKQMPFSVGFCQKSLVLKKRCRCEQKIHTKAISLQAKRYQNIKCNIQIWHWIKPTSSCGLWRPSIGHIRFPSRNWTAAGWTMWIWAEARRCWSVPSTSGSGISSTPLACR